MCTYTHPPKNNHAIYLYQHEVILPTDLCQHDLTYNFHSWILFSTLAIAVLQCDSSVKNKLFWSRVLVDHKITWNSKYKDHMLCQKRMKKIELHNHQVIKVHYLIFQTGNCPQLLHHRVRANQMHLELPLLNEGSDRQANCQVRQDSVEVV